jgi:hypothetical protein
MKTDAERDSLALRLRKLVDEGKAVAPQRSLRDVIVEIGRPPGPVTDAGTRALQEQRGDRV